MRVIIGGSGYLGVFLARRLRELGFPVRVFDLNRSPLLPGDVDFVGGDIRDTAAVGRACDGADRVYHLAALIPQRKAPLEVVRGVHILGTENVLRACVDHRVDRVVFLSSSEVYGRMRVIPCPEDAPLRPINEYGRNKVEGEEMCAHYGAEHGLRIAILRPPTLIGPEISEEGLLLMLKTIRDGGVLPVIGSGRNRVNALDVRDCADVVIQCGDRPEAVGQTFNISCDGVPDLLEIAAALKKHARSKVKVIRIPAPVGLAALRLLYSLNLSPIMPDHFDLLIHDAILDISRIKSVLGWSPSRTYLESSRDMYDWYVQSLKK